MGENLEVVWAEFSTLSYVVLLHRAVSAWYACIRSKVENSAQGLSCKLKFVHDLLAKV